MKNLLKYWICGFIGTGLLLVGGSAAWAECADGKSEAVLYTPSGNANTVCVSDNALPGIENANDHTVLNVCEEATCPCWDADTLDNLAALSSPNCYEDYEQLEMFGYDSQADWNDILGVLRPPEYYGVTRACAILPATNGLWSNADVVVNNLSQAEADACADILRASKWWNSECTEIQH